MSISKYENLVQVEPARAATDTTPSASPAYRHISAKDAFPTLEVSTLYQLFERSVRRSPHSPCLGMRYKGTDGQVGPFVFQTYGEVDKEVANIASGLANELGKTATQSISVFGANCSQWMITMQACNRQNLCCVPLYDSLGENAVEFIINHSDSGVVFVSTEKLPQLVKALDKVTQVLRVVVVWGAGSQAAEQVIRDKGFKVYSFKGLQELGAASPAFPVEPTALDIATIMYTSGTTGDPKGVILTHQAVLSGVTAVISYNKVNNLDFNSEDRLLSYLPLAHIFDRINEEWFLYMGASIGYWQGDVQKLTEDIAALKPAIFLGVPRVFDRIYSKVMAQVRASNFVRRWLFNFGFARKLRAMRNGHAHNKAAPFLDKLIFKKVADRFGGKLKAIVSGGAPLAPHVEDFLRVTMCCVVAQGYGLSETAAASFIGTSDIRSRNIMEQAGTVGLPTPVTEFCLESVPDMKYDALAEVEPKGEVLIRGPACFSGYHKDAERSREVIEQGTGWFHTGDVAVLTKSGAIQIIDRKKNIFKLSQGEYIAVEKLEAVYKKNMLVEQAWVYGDSFKSCVVAVVVPTEELATWAAANGIPGDMAQVCASPRAVAHVMAVTASPRAVAHVMAACASPKAVAHVMAALTATGKAEKLKGFEILKGLHLEPAQFTVEAELLTPTFKFKRPQLLTKYRPEIDALYAGIKD
ncbi:MAG: hypothetical protein WDW36_007501 [Sanguina aurantia]